MLTLPAVAKATRYNRETPPPSPQGVAHGNRAETTAEGQSLQQKGEPHTSRAEPRQDKTASELGRTTRQTLKN